MPNPPLRPRPRPRLVALLLLALVAGGASAPSAPAQQTYRASLELLAEGFTHPLMLTEAPDGSGRLFVVDQTGQIWVLTPDGRRLEEPFLDIEDRVIELHEHYDERGLLGLAFHPDYARNGRFYVIYSAPLRDEALSARREGSGEPARQRCPALPLLTFASVRGRTLACDLPAGCSRYRGARSSGSSSK